MSAWPSELLRLNVTQRRIGRSGPFSPFSVQALHTVVVEARHFFLVLLCGPWPWKEARADLCLLLLPVATTWA